MTCIVAVAQAGRVWLGGDSCMSDTDGVAHQCPAKVFRSGAFLVGYAGDTDYCHLLQYRLTWPARAPEDVAHFMAVILPDYMRETCRRAGVEVPDGAAVVAVAGQLWTLDGASADRDCCEYASVGSGSSLALGALCATQGRPAAKRVALALEAAARHRTDVAPPFTVLRLP